MASAGNFTEHSGVNGNTGGSQRGFDNQLLFANGTSVLNERAFNIGIGYVGAIFSADQFGRDGNPSCTTDGHSIDTQHDASLLQGQEAALLDVVMERDGAHHSPIEERGTFVNGSAIPEAHIEINGNLSAPDGEGAVADFEVFELKHFPLRSFRGLQNLGSERGGFVEGASLWQATTGLSKNEGEKDQDAHRHAMTLPPER